MLSTKLTGVFSETEVDFQKKCNILTCTEILTDVVNVIKIFCKHHCNFEYSEQCKSPEDF